jgi:AcrR family transcriptional regulator
MSPRRSVEEAGRTRRRLVERATHMASTDGLEGLTVGRVAEAAALSKSGVTRHFPTKERLQLETFSHAVELFTDDVWWPVADRPPGLERLLALCVAWMDHLGGETFPGGCFLTAAAAEFDGRSGPVRDAVAATLERWLGVLGGEVRAAVEAGDLAAGTDCEALAYQLNALALMANQARQLLGDDGAPARSLELMRAAIDTRRV